MALHASLTGADLHEPKGIASATIHHVYVANGAGSGTHQLLTVDSMNPASDRGYMHNAFTDISTAQNIYFVFPFAATITRITTVIAGAITVADSTIAVTKSGGASLGSITIAFTGSAEGTVDQLVPSANNTVTANQFIKLANDGGSTTAQRCDVTIEFTRTGA